MDQRYSMYMRHRVESMDAKAAVKRLIRRDDRFDAVQKIANLGYWEFDHTQNRISWSSQMFAIFGIDEDFVLKHDEYFQFLHPDDCEQVFQNFLIALESKEELNSEFRIIRPNGEVRYVYENVSFMLDEQNEIALTFGTIQDVTENRKLQHKLRLEEEYYKSLFEYNPDAVFSFDLVGNFISCNSALEQMFGYSREEFMKGNFHQYVEPGSLEETIQQFEETVRTLSPRNFDTVGVKNNGHIIEVNVTYIPIIVNEAIIGIYGIAKDITTKKTIERSLIEAELKYRGIVEQSIVGIFIAQEESFVYSNGQLDKMLGYPTLIGVNAVNIIHVDDRDSVMKEVRQLTEGKSLPNLCHGVVKRDGSVIICEVHIKGIRHQGAGAVIGMVLDITERRKTEELNQYLAYHDYLTELPNRRMFEEQLEQQVKLSVTESKKLALLLIDLDRFKPINDTLGHPIGDKLLKQMAARLKGYLVEGRKAYRIGGDEFSIILTGVRQENEILEAAEGLIRLIKEPFFIDGFELNLTASIGISQSPTDGCTVQDLMKSADTALYFAKSQGRDQAQFYASSLNVQSFKHFSLSNDLRKALGKNELFLQYMPRINAQTKEIVGVEALLRWNHPDWGLVSPLEFIPIAEDTGLIVPIGEWVLREACVQNEKWSRSGLPPITVSVNFSVVQLLKQNVLQSIDQITQETGLSPERLEIEITESSFITNEKEVTELLAELKKRKIKVSLDDFGTGYSSLHLLKRLALDTIKIDKSFVEEMLTDSVNKSIIQCIIQLAKELKMQVVAEGVENEEQYVYLKEQNCDEIQGYYFCRPVGAETIEQLLSDSRQLSPATKELEACHVVNRREYFRIEFEQYLAASMTIAKFKGRRVRLGSTEVFLRNIGPGGLRFMVGVKMPVNDDIILMFEIVILGHSYKLSGVIVWCNEIDSGIYEYGLQFELDEYERAEMLITLNQLAIALRGDYPSSMPFFTGDPIAYLKEMKK